jgi:predicted component of type VI protein secretion system
MTRSLKRLSPAELVRRIDALRAALALTQQQIAASLEIGEPAECRWHLEVLLRDQRRVLRRLLER